MFERFTTAARETVVRARAEARDLKHPYVGTEHLLIALLADHGGAVAAALRPAGVDDAFVRAEVVRRVGPRTGDDVNPDLDREAEDAVALRAIGIDLDAVRRAIEDNFGPGALYLPRSDPQKRRGFRRRAPGAGRSPFNDRAKKVLELSLREAVRLKHNYIAAEHLMLGLLREGRGLGAQILAEAGVDFDALRAELTRSLTARASA